LKDGGLADSPAQQGKLRLLVPTDRTVQQDARTVVPCDSVVALLP
jgi:hypothetical protein